VQGLNLIAACAAKNITAKKFRDLEGAQVYAEAERIELEKLTQRTERLLSTGRIRPGY
jgi:hypothetical protein